MKLNGLDTFHRILTEPPHKEEELSQTEKSRYTIQESTDNIVNNFSFLLPTEQGEFVKMERKEIEGDTTPFFSKTPEFANWVFDDINNSLKGTKSEKEHKPDAIGDYLEDFAFANEEGKGRFESFLWRFGLTLKEIEGLVKSLRRKKYNEAGVIEYIHDFIKSIKEADALDYYNFHPKLLAELEQMESIAQFKGYVDAFYPDIQLHGTDKLDLKFLESKKLYEQYRQVHFHYKILEAALLHYMFDKKQEKDFDDYLADQHEFTPEQLGAMEIKDKQLIVQYRINNTLQKFCDFFLAKEYRETSDQGRHTIPIKTKLLNDFGLNQVSVILHPSCRPKSPGSRIRKSLMKSSYPRQNYDYRGSLIKVELPEIDQLWIALEDEEFYDAATREQIAQALKEAEYAIRLEIGQNMLQYLPSLTGTTAINTSRTRGFLHPNQLRGHSSPDYIAIQATFEHFTVNDYPFTISNEFIIGLRYIDHAGRAHRQYRDLAAKHNFDKDREDILRWAMKYIIVPSDYLKHTKFDPKILNAQKLYNSSNSEEYLKRQAHIFRKANADSKIIPELVNIDLGLFKRIFTYNPPAFDYKVTGIKDKELRSRFSHLDSENIHNQVHEYAKDILQRESEYIIHPLIRTLESEHRTGEKQGWDDRDLLILEQKLVIVAEYLSAIDDEYRILKPGQPGYTPREEEE